jgi:hypothetical protein
MSVGVFSGGNFINSLFAAGKNAIINGNFGVWQRGTSFTTAAYSADRWVTELTGASCTFSRQTFTPGTAPVAGYESEYFYRANITGAGTVVNVVQNIEDSRILAGQTATVSFWAKANASRSISIQVAQYFGSGGSGYGTAQDANFTITTSWTRYTATFTIPSIAGKTIGTSSYIYLAIKCGGSVGTVDIWGVQLEAGSTATSFQTATGTVQGELAACQRYYIELGQGQAYQIFGAGMCGSTTAGNALITFPVQMRTTPSFTSSGSFRNFSGANFNAVSSLGISGDQGTPFATNVGATTTGLTAGNGYMLQASNDTTARLKFSAEL